MSFILGLIIGFVLGVSVLLVFLGKKAKDALGEFYKNLGRK